MGASVTGHWQGITDEQLDLQPGFWNDCKAWGDWMAERYSHPDVIAALEDLGLSALLSHVTEGMSESEVQWVSPDDLANAADRLRELVEAQDPRVSRIVETYALRANDVDPIHEELAQDLRDVAAIARYATEQGVGRMTLEVNW